MPSEANEPISQEKSGGSGVSRIFIYIAGGGAGLLIYGGALRWFPLVDGIDSPFFYPILGTGFFATIAVIVWRVGGLRVFKLKGRPSSLASWVGYGTLYGLIFSGVAAVGLIGAFAAWGLFVTLNGAMDFGPSTQRTYTVAQFHEDCGGGRAKDKSYYLLEPRGARGGGDGAIQARVNCSDDEGLPVDEGGVVAVGGEVVAEIKAGAFGESWQAGYRKG